MLWTRVVSSVLLAPLFLLVVYLETPWFTVLAAGVGGVVAYEYARMTNLIRSDKSWTWGARISVAAPIGAILALEFGNVLVAAVLIGVLTFIFFLLGTQSERRVSVQLIVPYAALPAVALAHVINVGGANSIYWLLAVVWATDIGAYVIGRTLGGPKLAPSISPNKTWSGAIGGVVCAAAASTMLLLGFGLDATAVFVGLSIILSIISQLGDLFESGLKRRFSVKDSGALIPGHGGVMDRFDGLWAAAPALAGVCIVTGGGIQSW